MQAEHAQLLVLASIAGELAMAGKEDEVVGGIPLLDDVQSVVDFAPQRLVGQVAGQGKPFSPPFRVSITPCRSDAVCSPV
jgi:hypothetical protein